MLSTNVRDRSTYLCNCQPAGAKQSSYLLSMFCAIGLNQHARNLNNSQIPKLPIFI
ncbi:hypothetical protein [Microcoleus sp. bin38.metabat.b11b12b14.051]|uniref:hypothetical protein n=1 Tax=Microcoleus sp. bin38.metabat.b11b12b14.051 TaxID=2742709 RepID=UPI0025FDD050|nr:hypothetical protein [Microcoleus sp. bin38.metabat.b11b12b14.051]